MIKTAITIVLKMKVAILSIIGSYRKITQISIFNTKKEQENFPFSCPFFIYRIFLGIYLI